jgi:diketogulonate reductase-like aldo/keto reductase
MSMTQNLSITSTATLNSGHPIPLLGFGTFQLEDGDECITAVQAAIEAGYRHIDTAIMYENEESVGRAIRDSGVPRDEIFITSKLPHDQFETDRARQGCQDSLQRLGTEYIDLYLLHWPNDETMMQAWDVLQEYRDKGAFRSIGVSNWTVDRFEKFFFQHTDEVPAVNQIELHPFFQRPDLLDYCRQKSIQVEGYSPLSRAEELDDPTIRKIAEAHGKSPAQVMIRWQLQQQIVVIPKSSHPERIRENADVFDFQLSDEDMQTLAGLDENESVIDYRPEGWY